MSVELPVTGGIRGFESYCEGCEKYDIFSEIDVIPPNNMVILCRHRFACKRAYGLGQKYINENYGLKNIEAVRSHGLS